MIARTPQKVKRAKRDIFVTTRRKDVVDQHFDGDDGMVERGQGVALWRQIDQSLSREIAAGAWQPGEQLPTEQALAARFQVNRHTIRRAIQAMVLRGLLRVSRDAAPSSRKASSITSSASGRDSPRISCETGAIPRHCSCNAARSCRRRQ